MRSDPKHQVGPFNADGSVAWPLKEAELVGVAFASLEWDGSPNAYVALEIHLNYPRFDGKEKGSRIGVMLPVDRAKNVATVLANCVEQIRKAVRSNRAMAELQG